MLGGRVVRWLAWLSGWGGKDNQVVGVGWSWSWFRSV